MSPDKYLQWDDVIEANKGIQAYISKNENMHYCDVNKGMITNDGVQDSDLYLWDGMH